jgi:hypothetical protein
MNKQCTQETKPKRPEDMSTAEFHKYLQDLMKAMRAQRMKESQNHSVHKP